jgi:hypothetical protein
MLATGSHPDSHTEKEHVGWMRLATSTSVVRRAVRVALVVGAILVAINHGDAILRGDLGVGRVLRILLTVLVPYCVSTYSSVSTMQAGGHSRAPAPRPRT